MNHNNSSNNVNLILSCNNQNCEFGSCRINVKSIKKKIILPKILEADRLVILCNWCVTREGAIMRKKHNETPIQHWERISRLQEFEDGGVRAIKYYDVNMETIYDEQVVGNNNVEAVGNNNVEAIRVNNGEESCNDGGNNENGNVTSEDIDIMEDERKEPESRAIDDAKTYEPFESSDSDGKIDNNNVCGLYMYIRMHSDCQYLT